MKGSQGATIAMPIANAYEVVATTQLEGNTYTSPPFTVTSGQGFRAQVLHTMQEGAYVFEVALFATAPNVLVFEKTTRNPVTFSILKNGRSFQSIVVTDNFFSKTVDLGVGVGEPRGNRLRDLWPTSRALQRFIAAASQLPAI